MIDASEYPDNCPTPEPIFIVQEVLTLPSGEVRYLDLEDCFDLEEAQDCLEEFPEPEYTDPAVVSSYRIIQRVSIDTVVG